MAQISYGSITIVDTNDIQRFYVQYAKNNSSAAAPTTGWSQNRPTWQNGTYIWQRTVAKREGVALAASDYGNPVCITGEKGDTGQQGNTGNGISSIVTTYCNYGSGTPVENYSGWSSNVPEYDSTKPNYWVKTIINYTSGNPDVTIYKDLGITEAAEKANLAVTTAQTANANSVEAISIAGSKNKIYYSDGFPSGGTYINGDTLFKQSSAGTVMYVYDEDYTDATGGHWKQEQFEENAISDLAITNAKIANLSGDKITANTIAGNKIVAHDITAIQLATDAIKSNNYVAGTAPFSNRGTFLDLSNGNMYSPVFGVNATENNQGAFIKGSVQAYDGKIGQNQLNYWYIGNYYDYNQLTSAYIKGNGTATIQLGNTSTWRLNTNRIHTAWNDDSQEGQAYKLHYPVYDSKYWDMGLHVPTSKTDKFIYIRNSSSSTSLTNLQNNINDQANGTNNYWNYQFYITSEGVLSAKSLKTINSTFEVTDGGSLYARNIYIKDQNGALTQIGGTDAAYLSKTGGIITGDLTIGNATPGNDQQYNGNLRVIGDFLNRSGNNITLQTNLASTAATALTGNSTSPISIGVTGTLPTSNGGTGNTSYNAGGVVYADSSSPKKLLSTAAGTSGYLLKSGGAGAPTWVDPGTLTVAAATKATQDEDGNVIKTTYLKLTGGNITGPVSFGDSVAIDDLSAGALVVTGNASFTNNIQANTINGVQVGSIPKFTDTITTITIEGSGNAITAIEATNGALKAIKGSTFLMGITNQQVINAIGYTPYNATNPNNYTTNTGTVESVQIQASGPLQSSVSTAQSSSLNTTISFKNQNANTILAGPSSGNAATPTFRALVVEDIPDLTKSKISDFPTTWALSSITGADDLKAIEALTGTSGLLKKTAANTWTLDTSAYVTSSGVTSITLTQGTGISIGSSGTAITSTGTRTISLADNYGDTKNPYASKTARYVLAAPAAAAGVPTFRALTKEDVGLNNVLNYGQVTAIGQGDNGTLRVWTGDPTSTNTNDYEDIAITITAYNQSTVSKAEALNLNAAVGTSSKPVYFKADGKPYAIDYTIEKSVPSNAVFTDTWNKVSTSQDGYVTKLPGDTTTFLRGDGTWGTPGGTYSLPLAADGVRGGVQIGYSSSGKNYAVQLSSEKMYVNVPWTDTTYTAGTGLSLNGTTFSNSGVLGIKGNKENSYRTGEVNLTPANLGAVKGNSYFFYGTCDSEADEVEKAVDCPDFTMDDLKPGAMICVIFSINNNGAVANLKLNVNETGAKPIKYIYNGAYSNIPSKDYIKLNQIYHFTYDGTNWIIQLNYNTNTNTLGYQLRTNSMSLPMTDKVYRYRLFFTSADNTHFVPANVSTSTNTTALRDVTSRKINPFGRICYYSSTSAVNAQARPGATTLYDQVAFSLGYSFNLTGADLTLTPWESVYIKCEPQSDGSAIIYSLEPYVQSLPETDDGFIYIFLGVAYSATAVELMMYHPVYWYKNGKLQPYVQNAQTINGHSVNTDVPSNAVFTDTWNALSTSQAGYVSQAPNSTSQFLRGDATWAAVTAANVGLGNVENTKLSTWTGSSNLTTTKVGTLAAAATKGVVTTLDTSANLPTAGAVSTAISNSITTALNNYVTLATEQTVSGRKTFQDLATTTFKDSTGSEYCNINYNQTLGALVFSFE